MEIELDTINKVTEISTKIEKDSIITQISKISYELAQSQNDSFAHVVLEYLKILIWPLIVVVLIFIFKSYIYRLFDRIINESDELSSSILGLNAKFRGRLSTVVESNQSAKELKENIENSVNQSSIDEFRLLSSYFFTKPLQVRTQTAKAVYKLSQSLTIEEILKFVSSPLPGERVAGFIGIKSHLDIFPSLVKDEKIINAINFGLDDGYSRVRYRVVEAILTSKNLISIFHTQLEELLIDENNKVVKKLILEALERE